MKMVEMNLTDYRQEHNRVEQIKLDPKEKEEIIKTQQQTINSIKNKIKVREKTELILHKVLYEIEREKENRNNILVYLATRGVNTIPMILVCTRQYALGNNSFYLQAELNGDISRFSPLFNKYHARMILKSLGVYKEGFNEFYEFEKKQDEQAGLTRNFEHYVGKFLIQNEMFVYQIVQAVDEEEISKLDEVESEFCIRNFVTAGCLVDPRVFAIHKAGLIKIEEPEKNRKLVRYLPHSLIIKNTKSGVTSISKRIGLNLNSVSIKSLEGISTSGKNGTEVKYSPLHEAAGHYSFDEFTKSSYTKVLDSLFGYAEDGEIVTVKNGTKIISKGCARIQFVANPLDLEGTTAPNPDDLLKCIEACFDKLTSSTEPAFSRFGFVLLGSDIRPLNSETALNDEDVELLEAIVSSALSHSAKKITQVFKENRKWLEQPIEEYNDHFNDVMKKTTSTKMLNAVDGSTNAFRHVRGGALALAVLDNVHKISNAQLINEELLQEAEAYVHEIVQLNLRSWHTLLKLREQYAKDEKYVRKVLQTSPEYLVAIYQMISKYDLKENETAIPFDELKSYFSSENSLTKKAFGSGNNEFWKIKQKLKDHLHRAQEHSEGLFGRSLFSSDLLVLPYLPIKNLLEKVFMA